MIRRLVGLASIAALLVLSYGCDKDGGGGVTADGGRAPKLICKMNNQCWVCPNDDAFKKCIINPVTSGCKLGTDSECNK